MFHLFLGLAVAWAFWWVCERYANKGLQLINLCPFILTVICGSSGLFPLRLVPDNKIPSFVYLAVPDWDIPLSVRTGWDFLTHRSLLFSSNILPIALIVLSCLLLSFSRKRSRTSGWRGQFLLLNIGIGLSVGVSAHLLGDVLLNLILNPFQYLISNLFQSSQDSHINFVFEIGDRGLIWSLVWVTLNFVIGLAVPFAIIKLACSHNQAKL